MKKLNIKPLASLALAAPLAACSTEEQKPNIILFLIDDLGWLDTSVAFGEEVYPFNLRHDTPNTASLAEQGVIMTSAYAMNLFPEHPLYRFVDGAFQPLSQVAYEA